MKGLMLLALLLAIAAIVGLGWVIIQFANIIKFIFGIEDK